MTRDITSNPVLKILIHSNYSTLETFGQWEINKIPIFFTELGIANFENSIIINLKYHSWR